MSQLFNVSCFSISVMKIKAEVIVNILGTEARCPFRNGLL
jgi:hypothetical protein